MPKVTLDGFEVELSPEQLHEVMKMGNVSFTKKTIYDIDIEGDNVFKVSSEGDVFLGFASNYEDELNQGRVFLTQEEAETFSNKERARASIKKWSVLNDSDHRFVPGEDNYSIGYDIKDKVLGIFWNRYMYFDEQYYSSKEMAKQAMEELEEEYLILFDKK